MKEFLEEDFKEIKGMVKHLNEIVFPENKKGFNALDGIILITFGLRIDDLLDKINKQIKEEKDEGNN